MFPRLRQRLGPAVLDRIDVLVELSTLGEYGLAEDGLPIRIAGDVPSQGDLVRVRLRDDCPWRGRISPGRCGRPARP